MNSDLHPVPGANGNQLPDASACQLSDRFDAAAGLHLQVQRYRTALRKRWWVLLLCLLFIGAPAVVYSLRQPPTFRSQAMMWLTSRLNLPGGAGFFLEEISSYLSTQADLMKSAAIQQRAFERVRAAFPQVALLATNPQPARLPFNLVVKTSPKSSVITLEATGPFPQPTRAFLDGVMAEYLDLKKRSYQRASVGALAGISDQIREVENQIRGQQDQLTAFEMSNNISYLTEQGSSAGSHLAKLSEMLSDLRTERQLLDLITPEQFLDASTGDRNAISSTTLPVERAPRAAEAAMQASDTAYYQALQQLEMLKATRDDFARVLRPTHSKMVKLNQQIAGLEQLIQTIKQQGTQRALAQMANRKKSIDLQVQSLEDQYREWETNSVLASGKLATHERMKEDLQQSRSLYDRLVTLVQTVDLNKDIDQEPLSPLAPASEAKPTHDIKVAALGIFLAFAAGLGLIALLQSLDDRFVSATELSFHVPEEVIGQIPETRLVVANQGSRWLRHPEEQHAFTESFSSIRSSLFFMFDQATPPRVILLTSSVPKEGKSTVAAHLAASLAISGAKVLLIDADLRRSSLHRIFGVDLKPGLREVLAEGLDPATAITPVPLPPALTAESPAGNGNPTAKLFLLPGGEAGRGPTELLLNTRMSELLKAAAARYDHVIIDSPPLLAAEDAVSLASRVDGIFVVVRAAYTYSRMVREALDRLHKRHARVLGLIYNRAMRSSDYYYRYSRDYHERGSPAHRES